MTHQGLFDFEANRQKEGAVHEGLWLHEPAVSVEQYERYFAGILAEGQRAGVRFTGLTWPGCGCEVCTRRYTELRASGHREPNPAMWKALLHLAQEGKFRGRTVPCFFDSSESEGTIVRKAGEGPFGVYDLMPNAGDHFGIWENNPKRVDPDYYITADGKSGIVVRHVQAGRHTASGMLTGRDLTRPGVSVGRRSPRWWSGSASICAIASSGCGPVTSPTATTPPAGGASWITCRMGFSPCGQFAPRSSMAEPTPCMLGVTRYPKHRQKMFGRFGRAAAHRTATATRRPILGLGARS